MKMYTIRPVVSRQITLFFFLCIVLMVSGCASAPQRSALPRELANLAEIPGVPNARFWGDEWPQFSSNLFKNLSKEELQEKFPDVSGVPHTYLAISGGGAEGAFGAGLLVGWTASGTRPEFSMVTGISTGALAAPFAFLGEEYDHILKEVYTTTSTSDILETGRPISIVKGGAMTDSSPLHRLIQSKISGEIITAIADEYQRGRKLLIGTYNLDAGRSVIWDIGAIAISSYPKKKDLIHDVLLASASIPVVFPPVLVEVSAGGQTYDEMHVDGGTGDQVFIYPASFEWKSILKKLDVPGNPRIFVIRNSFLQPEYSGVDFRILPIAERSISALIQSQGMGDLYEIYLICYRDGNDFNLAHIPAEFTERTEEHFDPEYMGKLFQLGFDLAVKGYDWKKKPPGF